MNVEIIVISADYASDGGSTDQNLSSWSDLLLYETGASLCYLVIFVAVQFKAVARFLSSKSMLT